MSKTALIILNYNNCRDTRNCVESVLEHNTAPVRFIVVDNASSKEQRAMLIEELKTLFPDGFDIVSASQNGWKEASTKDLTLVLSDENGGYARGNNLGLEIAYADESIDRVMILNNDILFVQDIIPSLIERQDSLPDCGVISPVLYKKDMAGIDINCARKNEEVKEMIASNFLHYFRRMLKMDVGKIYRHRYLLLSSDTQDSDILEIELPSGSCMLIHKDLFKDIGSFDPTTFLYYEENILYKKLSAIGHKNYLCLDLKCIHLGAATTSAMPKSVKIMQAGMDSQGYYVDKYSQSSRFTRALYHLSSSFFMFTFRLQKMIMGKK